MHDPDRFRTFVERFYELWNADDKIGWLDHWRAFAPGEPRIEDPVGKPVKRDWQMIEELWDRTTDRSGRHFKVQVTQILVCGGEVAAVCCTEGDVGTTPFRIHSVDVHQIRGDSLAIRSYWEIPPGLPYGQWTATAGEPVGAEGT